MQNVVYRVHRNLANRCYPGGAHPLVRHFPSLCQHPPCAVHIDKLYVQAVKLHIHTVKVCHSPRVQPLSASLFHTVGLCGATESGPRLMHRVLDRPHCHQLTNTSVHVQSASKWVTLHSDLTLAPRCSGCSLSGLNGACASGSCNWQLATRGHCIAILDLISVTVCSPMVNWTSVEIAQVASWPAPVFHQFCSSCMWSHRIWSAAYAPVATGAYACLGARLWLVVGYSGVYRPIFQKSWVQ